MMVNSKINEGKLETDRRKMIMVASEFYEKLYGRDGEEEKREKESERNMKEEREEVGEVVPRIEEWEVHSEIKKLKLGKTTGPDNIKNKMIEDYGEIVAKPLKKCFNMILENERTTTLCGKYQN